MKRTGRSVRTMAAAALALWVSGCGFKGPLYLPPKPELAPAPPPVVRPELMPDAIQERRPVPSEAAPPPK